MLLYGVFNAGANVVLLCKHSNQVMVYFHLSNKSCHCVLYPCEMLMMFFQCFVGHLWPDTAETAHSACRLMVERIIFWYLPQSVLGDHS